MLEAIARSLDITPERLLPAACHGPRNVASRRVALPLEANVLGLRENGRALFIVSIDWFFISPGFRDRILHRCGGHLEEQNLLLAASHTHTSPNPDPTKVGFSAADPSYVAWAEEAVATLVNDLLRSDGWQPACLRVAAAPCDCAIDRRRSAWSVRGWRLRRAMALFPNPAGARDNELRLLRVEGKDGSLLGMAWGVSCHPTEWPQILELSSDYPGAVRQALRLKIGRGLPVVFLQGFCGDLRPPAVGRWPKRGGWRARAVGFLLSLLNGPAFAGFSPAQYQTWLEGIVSSCQRALPLAASTPPVETALLARRTKLSLSALGLSGETAAVTIQRVEIGPQLSMVGISAEVCWGYAKLVRRLLAGTTVWPIGYIDSVFGYLPTQSMLSEGGYEVVGFKRPFGISGEFHPNLETIVAEAIAGCLS